MEDGEYGTPRTTSPVLRISVHGVYGVEEIPDTPYHTTTTTIGVGLCSSTPSWVSPVLRMVVLPTGG